MEGQGKLRIGKRVSLLCWNESKMVTAKNKPKDTQCLAPNIGVRQVIRPGMSNLQPQCPGGNSRVNISLGSRPNSQVKC